MSKYDDLIAQVKKAKETMPKDIFFKADEVSVRYRADCDDFVVTQQFGNGIADTRNCYIKSADMKKIYVFLGNLFG